MAKKKKSKWEWEWNSLAIYPCALKRGVIKKRKKLCYSVGYDQLIAFPPVTPTQSTQCSSECVQQLLLFVFFISFADLYTTIFPYSRSGPGVMQFFMGRQMRGVWRVDCTTGWTAKNWSKKGKSRLEKQKLSWKMKWLCEWSICKRMCMIACRTD